MGEEGHAVPGRGLIKASERYFTTSQRLSSELHVAGPSDMLTQDVLTLWRDPRARHLTANWAYSVRSSSCCASSLSIRSGAVDRAWCQGLGIGSVRGRPVDST